MRSQSGYLWDVWSRGGPFVGDDKAHGVVTVERDWYLNVEGNTGAFTKGPIRWWQRSNNSQVETVLPNVRTISIDRSIDTDAATCNITMYNQKMAQVNIDELGQPGYFTFNRGSSPEGTQRWGHVPNEWYGVLVPDALIRTYQGYGGHNKTLQQALVDGNLVLTGVWLVDDVRLDAQGQISLVCRDMAKLLIEQQIYPPLVPNRRDVYPLDYRRWLYQNYDTPAVPGYDSGDVFVNKRTVYHTSGSDVWYGPNASVHGHRPSHTLDGNTSTFWLSVGNQEPNASYSYEWIQYESNEQISGVYVNPWGGNYVVYISVFENGAWQGGDTIPYASAGVGIYDGYNAANIPYVVKTGLAWESPQWIKLPRAYSAQYVRITLTNLVKSQWGPPYYRAGIREAKMGATGGVPEGKFIGDIQLTPSNTGYWMVGSDGGVFTFGNAPFHGSDAGVVRNQPSAGLASTPSGNGYWLAGGDGGVFSFGDAAFHGSLPELTNPNAPIIDIEATSNGGGYWLVALDGGVFAFGNAGFFGSLPGLGITPNAPITDIAITPTGNGYYLLAADGGVFTFGDAVYEGNPIGTGQTFTAIIAHPHHGYWVASTDAYVYAYGQDIRGGVAGPQIYPTHGAYEPSQVTLNDPIYDMDCTSTGLGYVLVGGDGGVFTFGDATFWGSLPAAFAYQLRFDGNYKDYSDIVKELLLWSGWWLQGQYEQDGMPSVYGNIETTGAYAEEAIPRELFDKKPVIDAITQLKEIVGYLFWVDEEGAVHFESPNWWSSGNFMEDGSHTEFIPEIDERVQLTSYAVSFSDKSARSEIIITTEDPTADHQSTKTTRHVPATKNLLRGMVRPAMWVNGLFTNDDEQRIMAELIGLHIYFATRQSSIAAAANPAIQINDQVRIYERVTHETYTHYVRGMTTNMDLETGVYTMNLTTHWLGDYSSGDWAVTKYNISNLLQDYLNRASSRSIAVSRSLDPGSSLTTYNN